MSTVWDNKPVLDELERQRNVIRSKGKRITFDCMNTMTKGDRVFCSKGRILGQARDRGIALVSVLRGICSGSCKNCEDFNT